MCRALAAACELQGPMVSAAGIWLSLHNGSHNMPNVSESLYVSSPKTLTGLALSSQTDDLTAAQLAGWRALR